MDNEQVVDSSLLDGLDTVSVEAHPSVAEYLRKCYWPADSVLAAHALRGIQKAGYILVKI